MRPLARLSPVAAYRDLRAFLASRERHELGFLALAMGITGFFVFMFVKDSQVEVYKPPSIIYVRQWRADRTDAEIKAQQVIDEAARQRQARIDAADRERRRLEFKRLDDTLSNMGF